MIFFRVFNPLNSDLQLLFILQFSFLYILRKVNYFVLRKTKSFAVSLN